MRQLWNWGNTYWAFGKFDYIVIRDGSISRVFEWIQDNTKLFICLTINQNQEKDCEIKLQIIELWTGVCKVPNLNQYLVTSKATREEWVLQVPILRSMARRWSKRGHFINKYFRNTQHLLIKDAFKYVHLLKNSVWYSIPIDNKNINTQANNGKNDFLLLYIFPWSCCRSIIIRITELCVPWHRNLAS